MNGQVDIDAASILARALVERYLHLCELRDITEADSLLSPAAVLEFPGGRRYSSVGRMAADAVQRYRRVTKQIDEWRCASLPDGGEIVVCMGTLAGVAINGEPFDGVRFIDVFEIRDGKIVTQRVWNDLAEGGIVKSNGYSHE